MIWNSNDASVKYFPFMEWGRRMMSSFCRMSLTVGGLAGWSAGLKAAISSPTLHCSGLMSNVTLWPLSSDQLLNSLLSACFKTN